MPCLIIDISMPIDNVSIKEYDYRNRKNMEIEIEKNEAP